MLFRTKEIYERDKMPKIDFDCSVGYIITSANFKNYKFNLTGYDINKENTPYLLKTSVTRKLELPTFHYYFLIFLTLIHRKMNLVEIVNKFYTTKYKDREIYNTNYKTVKKGEISGYINITKKIGETLDCDILLLNNYLNQKTKKIRCNYYNFETHSLNRYKIRKIS